jgi:NAD(P)-dependent dehydrogenase (short-subunit alcohol dehydrogenase family)
MLDAKKGHIVSIAGMASYFTCCGLVDYAATKAGVLALHEGTSSEIFDMVVYCVLYCKLTPSTQRSQPRTQTPIWPERPLHSDLHRAPHVGSNASCKGLAGVSCCIEDVRLATFGSL